MSKVIAKATAGKTSFEIREIDENAWKAVVFSGGGMYVCDYAPGDEKSGADPETGAPTIDSVKDAWKHERSAFRQV